MNRSIDPLPILTMAKSLLAFKILGTIIQATKLKAIYLPESRSLNNHTKRVIIFFQVISSAYAVRHYECSLFLVSFICNKALYQIEAHMR